MKPEQLTKEQKWGFWLYMVNTSMLFSTGQVLMRMFLQDERPPFSYYVGLAIIATLIEIGIYFLIRNRSWNIKIRTSILITAIWLAVCIASALR